MIDVIVGMNANLWKLHKKVICGHSPFFSAALNGHFAEGIQQKVELPEDDNAIFTLFVLWIYTKYFENDSLPDLLKAYVLGDKLGAVNFRSSVIDKIHNMHTNASKCRFTLEQALWVSENTLPDSSLRSLTIDTISLGILNKSLQRSKEDWERMSPIHVELLQAIANTRHCFSWYLKERFCYPENP